MDTPADTPDTIENQPIDLSTQPMGPPPRPTSSTPISEPTKKRRQAISDTQRRVIR